MSQDRIPFPFEDRPVVGMVHLRPLPGTMYFDGSLDDVIEQAMRDAGALVEAGFDGLIVENFGDAPFRKSRVEPHTVAAMTAVAAEIVNEFDVPLGINVLRNDPFAAVAVASAVGARFIRVNVLSGAMVTDQGIIEGEAADLFAYIDRIAPEIAVWADIAVKHAAPLVHRPIVEVARETAERAGAHVLIVTGTTTGEGVDPDELSIVRSVVDVPVVVGSGVTEETIVHLRDEADGLIVGSATKEHGDARWPVDPERAARLLTRG